MTHLAGATLLGLISEDVDLLALAVLKNGTLYESILNIGLAYLKSLIAYSDDLVKGDLLVDFSIELLTRCISYC